MRSMLTRTVAICSLKKYVNKNTLLIILVIPHEWTKLIYPTAESSTTPPRSLCLSFQLKCNSMLSLHTRMKQNSIMLSTAFTVMYVRSRWKGLFRYVQYCKTRKVQSWQSVTIDMFIEGKKNSFSFCQKRFGSVQLAAEPLQRVANQWIAWRGRFCPNRFKTTLQKWNVVSAFQLWAISFGIFGQ